MNQIPLILHTDIGTDIDDSWALAMMLQQPQLKPLLVITDTGDTLYRAAICTKMLQDAGRTEVEVATGCNTPTTATIRKWVQNTNPADYKGRFSPDGPQRLIQLIMDSPYTPVTLLSIGPCPAIAKALAAEPRIAPKTRFVGMFGSIFKGYNGAPQISAEYNVKSDIPACQALFRAPWAQATITPLDTCGLIRLTGKRYQDVRNSTIPVVKDVIQSYDCWADFYSDKLRKDAATQSSILYDTVAMHLVSSTSFLKMQQLNLSVTDDGFTVIDNTNGRPFNVAIDWLDIDAYADFLVKTLTTPTHP